MTIFQKRLNTIKNSIDAEVYESLLHSTKEERFGLIQWHLDNAEPTFGLIIAAPGIKNWLYWHEDGEIATFDETTVILGASCNKSFTNPL